VDILDNTVADTVGHRSDMELADAASAVGTWRKNYSVELDKDNWNIATAALEGQ